MVRPDYPETADSCGVSHDPAAQEWARSLSDRLEVNSPF